MNKVLVIDTLGDSHKALEDELGAAGWEVATTENATQARTASVDAVILATNVAGLGQTLREVQAACKATGAPLVLVADLDRSGWEQTFGAAEALEVDAFFDKPVAAEALVNRLEGIRAARREANAGGPAPEMSTIIARAIANEEEAAAFYRRVAWKVSDATTRDTLEELMRDEQQHKRIIEEFRSGQRPLPKNIAPGGSLLECFGAPDFNPNMSPADSFLLAAKKEKLAVEFYERWADLYSQGPEREILLHLVEIERNHKAKVEAMFACAAFPESW